MRRTIATAVACLAFAWTGNLASAQIGPDVITHLIGDNTYNGGGTSDYAEYGLAGTIRVYSAATTSCNIGDQTAEWISGTSGRHPVIHQGMYRLMDGRFEQIGMNWLKHSFCAVSEPGCQTCFGTGCSTLGIGCADTYWATLNGSQSSQSLGPKTEVNPSAGTHIHPVTIPVGGFERGRLQVEDADIQPAMNPGALYFIEAQYVTKDEAESGNAMNNASYRKINVQSVSNLQSDGNTVASRPAIFAWAAFGSGVSLDAVDNIDEAGPGMHGRFWVGTSVTDNGDGTWHYEYAVQNLNSDRCAGRFEIPVGNGVTITNIGFSSPFYHSGEPQAPNGTPWAATETGSSCMWESETWASNLSANSLRWGTTYNFRFDADSPPQDVTAEIGLWRPGTPDSLTFITSGPSDASEPGSAQCYGDGTGAACPCSNTGGTGEGCLHSGGQGMTISGSGTNSISADDLTLTAEQVPVNNTGIFYVGTTTPANTLYDGIQCAGGDVRRFQGVVQGTGTASDTNFVAQAGAGYFLSGNTYNFQFWSRDVDAGPSPCGTGANFSPGYAVTMSL